MDYKVFIEPERGQSVHLLIVGHDAVIEYRTQVFAAFKINTTFRDNVRAFVKKYEVNILNKDTFTWLNE